MNFKIIHSGKELLFDSELKGLRINGREYNAEEDGILIYDKTKDLTGSKVELQMSTNTSTLIPAMRTLGIPYNPYFDDREVVESQNNIVFYWKPSYLAAYYNLYSTDRLLYKKREPVIRRAFGFLIKNTDSLPLKEELLDKLLEPCKLLGFYEGFPIFESDTGFAKLLSRIGIHVGSENIMISTPLDKYSDDVYELAEKITLKTGEKYSRKKNRVIFERSSKLLKLLNI